MGLQRRDFVVVLYFKFTIQSIKQNINGQIGFFGNIILIHRQILARAAHIHYRK